MQPQIQQTAQVLRETLVNRALLIEGKIFSEIHNPIHRETLACKVLVEVIGRDLSVFEALWDTLQPSFEEPNVCKLESVLRINKLFSNGTN